MAVQKTGASTTRRPTRLTTKRWFQRLALGGVLAGFAAGGWAFDDVSKAPGLSGILPSAVPEALEPAAFEPLGPNWETWGQQTAAEIAAFYSPDGSLSSQTEALKALKRRLGVMDRAIADPAYTVILEPLLSIRGPLARRVAIAEAALTTLSADPKAAREAAVKASGETVSKAVAALTADLNGVPGGSAWLPFAQIDELKSAWAESQESAATVAALNATLGRINRREALTDAAQKAFLQRPAFDSLHKAITSHLSVVETQPKSVDPQETRKALAALVAALEDYEVSNSEVAAGDVRKALQALRDTAPDGGAAVRQALSQHYFNHNVRIVASEKFLSRLLADSRVEQGQVNDYILGAAVGGWQTTATSVSVDLKPSKDSILFDLVLNGTVQSSTAGRTDQATIYTSGYHTFRSAKEVRYDGKTFTTGPAATGVNANNTTTGATTRLSGAPLLGQMAQRIAMREAAARRPQSEAIAAGRVANQVTPRFNSEVDKAFADASKQINDELMKGLKETGLYPDHQSYSSTADAMRVSSRLMGEHRLGGFKAENSLLAPGNGAAMLMHESAVNNAIDQIGFNGKTMSEEELRAHLEDFLSRALSREIKFRSPEDADVAAAGDADAEEREPAQLVFAKEDPVRVQFRNGELLLVIRAGLERQNGDPIPAHEIVVPLQFEVQGDKIAIRRDALTVLPIEGDPMPLQQRVMNSRISSALPDREVSGEFKLRGPSREVAALVKSIRIIDGWIAVQVE